MEDYHHIEPNFMNLPVDYTDIRDVLPAHLPAMLISSSLSVSSTGDENVLTRSADISALCDVGESVEAFHLFSLYDGHGGSRAAEHCANVLASNLKSILNRTLNKHALPIREIVRHKTVPTHVLLAEAINLADIASSEDEGEREEADTTTPTTTLHSNAFDAVREEEFPKDGSLFSTMSIGIKDRCEVADAKRPFQASISGRFCKTGIEPRGLTTSQLISCLTDAFVLTDNNFDSRGGHEESGTTALAALISSHLLCFANCGDCRAVLYRDEQILQVTREHSPECTDERERIEQLGGRIITVRRDAPRVMGVLNMTRAIGDFGLKPFIIPNPEVTIIRRCTLDKFLVLASDGLWAVLDNRDVCDLVLKCFDRVESRGLRQANASKVAANLLIRKALDNGSPDNITVIVIDLRDHH